MKNDLSNKQFAILGAVGAVCTIIIITVGAVVVEICNLVLRGKSITEVE